MLKYTRLRFHASVYKSSQNPRLNPTDVNNNNNNNSNSNSNSKSLG